MTGRAGALVLLLLAPPAAADLAPPGGEAVVRDARPLSSHEVATAPFRPDPVTVTAEGAVTRTTWQVPGATTSLALLAPLREALEADGYEIVFQCETDRCGGFDFRFGIDVTPAPGMFVNIADFRYLAARKGEEWVTLLASVAGRMGHVQTTRVGDPGAPAPVVSTRDVALGGVGRSLQATGRAVLADVTFGTGSTELPGDYASLAELADYMAADPAVTVALVGHTDAEGGPEGNLAISKRRAEAARRLLIERHGVAADRVEAYGVGYFAPLARNDSAEARAANRRVEAVVTSVE
ncbi:OmpA family protein [Jannaschia sp. Os4]|uniref:OmpA family protein n=1 Tax=Jannaschia sp. Os4 TaxID=2807617 RepID=UPI00193A3344|nr:OmpA family protein [Jannaschia sp. Os4]MBM2575167.1 OmpA family protein [Jannaschia sp. Os4]